MTPLTDLPVVVTVIPDHGTGSADGHDPRSRYVEQFWLPILGPTGTWLLRYFAYRFDEQPGGFPETVAVISSAIGVPVGGSSQAFGRTVARCQALNMLSLDGDRLSVSTTLRTLKLSHVERLPDHLRAAHREWYRTCAANDYDVVMSRSTCSIPSTSKGAL